MKIILTLSILVALASCQSTPSETKSKNQNSTEEKTNKNINDIPENIAGKNELFFLRENSKYKFEISNPITVSISNENELNISVLENNFKVNIERLLPRLPSITFNNTYHQQIAFYLFENTLHEIEIKENGIIIHIINPPKSKYWTVIVIDEKKLTYNYSSYHIPQKNYQQIFEKINNYDFTPFATLLENPLESKKIMYNDLRKLIRFNEGIVTALHTLTGINDTYYKKNIFWNEGDDKNLNRYHKNAFQIPAHNEFGLLDSIQKENISMSNFNLVKGFNFKTSTTHQDTNTVLYEIQIDFKTTDNRETIRMVMGGILLNAIPVLKNEEMSKGLFLPMGFALHEKENKKFETYLLMGNTAGLWVDITNNTPIYGVILYYDKNVKGKLHIWLMSGYGEQPVAHYSTMNIISE